MKEDTTDKSSGFDPFNYAISPEIDELFVYLRGAVVTRDEVASKITRLRLLRDGTSVCCDLIGKVLATGGAVLNNTQIEQIRSILSRYSLGVLKHSDYSLETPAPSLETPACSIERPAPSPARLTRRSSKLDADDIFVTVFRQFLDQLSQPGLVSAWSLPVVDFLDTVRSFVNEAPERYIEASQIIQTILKKHGWRFGPSTGFYSPPDRNKFLRDLKNCQTKFVY